MNEQKTTYPRLCNRCGQRVMANNRGMLLHGFVCLRFDWRSAMIRQLTQGVRYIPAVSEDSTPTFMLANSQKLRQQRQVSSHYHGRGPGSVRRHGVRNAFQRGQ